jgi:hypothetical protein
MMYTVEMGSSGMIYIRSSRGCNIGITDGRDL